MVRLRDKHNPYKWKTCPICGKLVIDKKALIYHLQNDHHPQEGRGDPHDPVFGPDENPFAMHNRPREMRAEYERSLPYVLKKDDLSDPNIHIYSFPIKFTITDNDIDKHLKHIYDRETHAFKLDFAAGVLLWNVDTKKWRYFAPQFNASLLERPLVIYGRLTLQKAIEALQQMDLNTLIRNYRPNSSWKVQAITNIDYYAYNLNYVLGSNEVELPGYVRSKRCIIVSTLRLSKNPTNICAFVALALHMKGRGSREKRGIKRLVESLLYRWVRYCRENAIDGYSIADARVDTFPGLQMAHLDEFEQCFKLNVAIYELTSENTANTVRVSHDEFTDTMYLNLYKNHLSYIQNFTVYASRYPCMYCNMLFKSAWEANRHQRSCMSMSNVKLPGGCYAYHQTVFEKLEALGVKPLREKYQYSPWICVFDFEAVLKKYQYTIAPGAKTKYISVHEPISVSVCSNVTTELREPVCLIHADADILIDQLFNEFKKHRQAMLEVSEQRYKNTFRRLKKLMLIRHRQVITDFDAKRHSPPATDEKGEPIVGYAEQLDLYTQERRSCVEQDYLFRSYMDAYKELYTYAHRLTVLSFNGARYDLHLILRTFMNYLIRSSRTKRGKKVKMDEFDRENEIAIMMGDYEDEDDEEETGNAGETRENNTVTMSDEPPSVEEMLFKKKLELPGPVHVLKRQNSYLTVSNNHFNFLDVCAYLPPGNNLRQFLNAYGQRADDKYYFPYDFLTDVSKLKLRFPPYGHRGWKSTLKGGQHLLEEEHSNWELGGKEGPEPKTGREKYKQCLLLCMEHNVKTMRDYLILYNNSDTAPFLKACEFMQKQLFDQKLDVFKISCSLPGISRIKMMQYPKEKKIMWPLIHPADEDMYWMFKSQLTGGCSLILSRYAEVDVTPIEHGSPYITKSLIGLDANALYMKCLREPQKAFMYVRRRAEDGFVPHYREQFFSMYCWMSYLEEELGWTVRNRMNTGRDFRFGPFLADGVGRCPEGNLYVLEYLGCFVHRCTECKATSAQLLSTEESKEIQDRWERKRAFYETLPGFRLKYIREHDWKAFADKKTKWAERLKSMKPKFLRENHRSVSADEILAAVGHEVFTGFLVVDLSTPMNNPEVLAKMRKFPIIFANHSLSEQDITSPCMREEMTDLPNKPGSRKYKYGQPKRLLLSGFHAKRILVSSELLKFYIQFGLVVDRVYEVIEYVESNCFEAFVDEVTRYRQEASMSKDPAKEVVAQTFKLLGNASYGSMRNPIYILYQWKMKNEMK